VNLEHVVCDKAKETTAKILRREMPVRRHAAEPAPRSSRFIKA